MSQCDKWIPSNSAYNYSMGSGYYIRCLMIGAFSEKLVIGQSHANIIKHTYVNLGKAMQSLSVVSWCIQEAQ